VRSRRRRSRRPGWRRTLSRLLANLSLGFLLAGCASTTGAKQFAGVQSDLKNPHDLTRAQATLMLDAGRCSKETRPDAEATLANLAVSDPSPIVRACAVQALATHASDQGPVVLVRAAKDPESIVREAAAKALAIWIELDGWFGTDCVTPLLALSADSDVQVRRAAVASLAHAGAAKTRQVTNAALVARVNDPDFIVAQAARKELVARTGADLGGDAQQWANKLRIDAQPPALAARPGMFPVGN
jgi:HEAT repeat protein